MFEQLKTCLHARFRAVGSGSDDRHSPANAEWPQSMCGPPGPAAVTKPKGLHLGLFGNLQRVVDLNPEVSDGALQLAVTE
jgi:hypothetical protein